jgi:serine/threonine protein kinase
MLVLVVVVSKLYWLAKMADASGGRLIFSRTPDSNIGGPNSKAKSKNTIYRGTFNGRPVAVREVHFDSPNSSPTGQQSNKQRFIKECQVLLTLRHDNIVRCLDYRLSNDKPNSEGWVSNLIVQVVWVPSSFARCLRFVILELCQGTLEDFLVGRLGNDDVKPPELVWQITAGLDYLHQNNITHGNLNPRKIMVMKKSDLTFKITGFGLLKATNKVCTNKRKI